MNLNWINITNNKRPPITPSRERSSGYAAPFVGLFVALAFVLAPAPSPVQAQPAISAHMQRPLADVLEEVTPAVVNIAVNPPRPPKPILSTMIRSSGAISTYRKQSRKSAPGLKRPASPSAPTVRP
jgi:S1-C subfamily serine protease